MNIRTNINIIFGTDEKLTARFSEILSPEGYTLFTYSDNEINAAVRNDYSAKLVILCMTGFDVIENIRSESTLPIIYAAEKADEFTTIMALSKGADAVVPANISDMEFAARVKAMLRRSSLSRNIPSCSSDKVLSAGGICLDTVSREVTVNGERTKLTKLEFGILEYLMRRKGTVCSPESIYSDVWNSDSYDIRKTIVEHIRRLRGKIESDPSNPAYIKVVFGAGYIFSDAPAVEVSPAVSAGAVRTA